MQLNTLWKYFPVVNRLPIKLNTRCYCTPSPQYILHPLVHRGFVRVRGADSSSFLQGLLTNSLECLDTKCSISSLYSFLLNVQGRVLYDTIVYSLQQKDDYLLECELDVVQEYAKTVKRYKLRKKIDISDATAEFQAHAVFSPHERIEDRAVPNLAPLQDAGGILINSIDPRVKELGRRIVTVSGTTGPISIIILRFVYHEPDIVIDV